MGIVACQICGSMSGPVFSAAEYTFYRCVFCRTAFVHPTPSAEKLSTFYERFHQAKSQGGMYDDFEERMRSDFPSKLSLIKAAHPPGWHGRLLDVGCGKGYFVRSCADAGIDAAGIDISESGIAFARDNLAVTAYAGSLSELKNNIGTYEVATLWATIEHLPDPVRILSDISHVLEPGGRLFLDTGIGDDWLDRTLPGRVQWYDPPQHLFVFSSKGLELVLEKFFF